MRKISLAFLLLIGLLNICSCKGSVDADTPKAIAVKADTDFVKLPLKYAQGFEVYKNDVETKIVVLDLANGGQVLKTYHLKSSEVKAGESGFQVPLGGISVSSTSHAAYMMALGLAEAVKGVQWASYVLDEKLIGQIQSGYTKDISGAETVDMEKLLATQCKAISASPFELEQVNKYESIGIPVLLIAEYQEVSVLARAEWIKFFAYFYGLENEADEIFNNIVTRYDKLKRDILPSSFLPAVMIGSEYNGIWYVPGKESLIANLIRDAGARYLFQELEGAKNHQVDMEIIIQKAAEIDFWGKISSTEIGLEKLRTDNPKLGSLHAMQEGNVFYCNATSRDYFGQAMVEPDILLADLIYLFHPEYMDGHQPKYFVQAKK